MCARSLPPLPAAKGGHPSLRGGESELFWEDSCIVCPFAATPPCEEVSRSCFGKTPALRARSLPPTPARRGVVNFGRESAREGCCDIVQDALRILEYILILKAYDFETEFAKVGISDDIIFSLHSMVMNFTVEFNNQAFGGAAKVDYVRADTVLSTKFAPHELTAFKH